MFFKNRQSLILLTVFIFSILSMIITAPLYAQTNQTIELKEGFNFVSLRVTPQDSLSVFLSSNTQIEDIFLYSPAASTFLSVSDNSITSIGAGKGYIFLSKGNSSITITGEALSNINDIKMAGGFNLVGFSKVPETITFSQLMAKYSFITGIYSWSPSANAFISVVRNSSGVIEKLDDSDPVITAGKSYFFYVNKNTSINYDGSSIILDGRPGDVEPLNPAVTDIKDATFDRKALVAINTSGSSKGLDTQAVGIVPQSINGPSKMIINFNSKKSGGKDRCFINRAPLTRTAERKRPIVTENDAKYTFKVAVNETETKDLPATKVYGSAESKCLVFVDDAINASAHEWNLIGQKFDNEIYTDMTSAFGNPTDIDSNGKIVILYYDMGVAENSTLGYFLSNDLTLDNGYNEMEIFYMNIKWGIDKDSDATANPVDAELIRTLAHEFQHLINYGQRVMIRKVTEMDTWIDEGMAESAEQLIGKTPGAGRIDTIKADSSNKIRNGAPLCVWNQDDKSYALAYTFMQYCKNHARDREGMFKQLIAHTYGDYRAIEEVMKEQQPSFFKDFASIVTGYRLANLIGAPAGIYSYGSESDIFNFKDASYAPASVSGIKLGAGGSVYIYPSDSDLNSFVPNGHGPDIRFIRINK